MNYYDTTKSKLGRNTEQMANEIRNFPARDTIINPSPINKQVQRGEKIPDYIAPTYLPIERSDFKNIPPLVEENGELRPNPLLWHVVPYFLTFDEIAGANTLVLAANSSNQRSLSNDDSGIMDIRYLTHVVTSDAYTVEILHTGLQQKLMNRPIYASAIFGNGNIPFELPAPLILDKGQDLQFIATDLSGAPNTLRNYFTGQRYYEYSNVENWYNQHKINFKNYLPFFYTTDSGITIPLNATTTGNITILDNADFFLSRIQALSPTNQAFELEIINTSTSQSWSNTRIHYLGIGQQATATPSYTTYNPSVYIKRGSKLNLRFTDLSGANNTVYIVLSGVHYYYKWNKNF